MDEVVWGLVSLEDALDDSGYSDEDEVDFPILQRNINFEDIALFEDLFENDPGDPGETNTPDLETNDEHNTSADETDE